MARNQSRTTSFDVAALAGVSQSVVSRAFTPGARIAAETREKVIAAARKLNYVPNSIATIRRRLTVSLVHVLPRCPCCLQKQPQHTRSL